MSVVACTGIVIQTWVHVKQESILIFKVTQILEDITMNLVTTICNTHTSRKSTTFGTGFLPCDTKFFQISNIVCCFLTGTTMLFITVYLMRTLASFLIMMTHRLMRQGCHQDRSNGLLLLELYTPTGETNDMSQFYSSCFSTPQLMGIGDWL